MTDLSAPALLDLTDPEAKLLQMQCDALEACGGAAAALIDRYMQVGSTKVELRYFVGLKLVVDAARAINAIPPSPLEKFKP